jgi:vancomycin resistance protein VanJ
LKSFNPSVIGLVEADQEHEVDLDEWKRHFPEYEVVGTSFGGLIAVKGKVVSHQLHHLASASFCEQFDVRVDQNDFAVLLVDITSDFRKSRQRPLLALATLANDLADRPVVIMGDFNTPDDSIWLASLQEHHREAFRERGTGYAATWPMPLPVLTLDQVWVNEFVEVSRCVHHWTIDSDHRPVVSDVSFHVPN